jgi:hypothetical protein
MIILLAASTISLTATQAIINAPREAFRSCLKQTSSKAANEKVTADAYEAYIKTNCGNELGSFKAAVVKFDMGNKMSRKAADDDADSMINDFVSSELDNYKYVTGSNSVSKKDASAPKPASTTPPTPTPTPASAPQSPH